MPFPDIPRLYTAIAEWLACMVYIVQLPLRKGAADQPRPKK